MAQAGLRAKRLLRFRSGGKMQEGVQAPQSPSIATAEGWKIKALFTAPGRRLPGGGAIREALLRPLAAVVRRPRQPEAPAAAPAAAACPTAGPARGPPLQTALSIHPIPQLKDSTVDGLDSEVLQAQMRRGHGQAEVALEGRGRPESRHGRSGQAEEHQKQGRQQQEGRATDMLDLMLSGAAEELRRGRLSRQFCRPRPPRPASSAGPAAVHGAAEAAVRAVLEELAAVRRHRLRQAALLEDCRACAADMRQRVGRVQGQLSQCEEQILALELQELAVRQAAQQEAQLVAEQVDAMQHDILCLASATATERAALEAAAADSLDAAAGLEAVAVERLQAAATWKRRYELMRGNHRPLTEQERQKRDAQWLAHQNRVA